MPRPLAVLMILVPLAGCAGDAQDGLSDVERAAQEVDVEATSTTGVIRGFVVDATITPVANVTVTIQTLNRTATTTSLGAFGFDALEPGVYFLQTSHPDYSVVQQSAEVVAGVQDPDPVRILVTALARGDPLIAAYTATIFVDSSIILLGTGYTLGGVTTDHSYWFQVDIEPNATVAQTEVRWEMTTPLGEAARVSGGTYAGNDRIATEGQNGPGPLVFRANATDGDGTADNVYYQIFAGDSMGLPGGMLANQQFDCFVHVFYNFRPAEGWVFGVDGEHPLPP